MATQFIFLSDFAGIISEPELTGITDEDAQAVDETVLKDAVKKAISKITKYLLRRYQVNKLYFPIYQFVQSDQREAGDNVFFTDEETGITTLYEALQDTQNNPLDDEDYWKAVDNRDDTLVEYTIYFALYILFTRIAKKNVPEDRFEQYNEAKKFFEDIRDDKITPGWPLLLDSDTGEVSNPPIWFQSNARLNHYY